MCLFVADHLPTRTWLREGKAFALFTVVSPVPNTVPSTVNRYLLGG